MVMVMDNKVQPARTSDLQIQNLACDRSIIEPLPSLDDEHNHLQSCVSCSITSTVRQNYSRRRDDD